MMMVKVMIASEPSGLSHYTIKKLTICCLDVDYPNRERDSVASTNIPHVPIYFTPELYTGTRYIVQTAHGSRAQLESERSAMVERSVLWAGCGSCARAMIHCEC